MGTRVVAGTLGVCVGETAMRVGVRVGRGAVCGTSVGVGKRVGLELGVGDTGCVGVLC